MFNKHFNSRENSAHHECKSHREGDWLIVRCTTCEDYERRFNWRTGEIKSRRISYNIYQIVNREFADEHSGPL